MEQVPLNSIPKPFTIPGHFYPYKPTQFPKAVESLLQKLKEEHITETLVESFLTHQGMFYIDTVSKRQTRSVLLQELRQPTDTLISKTINRPLSLRITYLLAPLPIHPHVITMLVFVMSVVAAYLLSIPAYGWTLLGGFLFHLGSVLDGCDGELARLKYQQSVFGGYLDDIGDELGHIALLIFLSLRIEASWAIWVALLASVCLLISKAAQYATIFMQRKRGIKTIQFFFDPTDPSNRTSLFQKGIHFLSLFARRDMLALFVFLCALATLYGMLFWVVIVFSAGVTFVSMLQYIKTLRQS